MQSNLAVVFLVLFYVVLSVSVILLIFVAFFHCHATLTIDQAEYLWNVFSVEWVVKTLTEEPASQSVF